MDPLSDVMALVKVRSMLSARMEGAGPWAMRFPAYQHIKFGGVIEGKRWLWIDGEKNSIELDPGDFYLLTDGRPYCFASSKESTLVDSKDFLKGCLDDDGIIRFGQGEPRTIGAGGRFDLDESSSHLLVDSLPPIIHIKAGSKGARALKPALQLIAIETEKYRIGNASIVDSLANIILVNILRAYLSEGVERSGWLRGLADPKIGKALEMMHKNVAYPWRVDELASAVAMSRTNFYERFNVLTGVAPGEYLFNWRMNLAKHFLSSKNELLSETAQKIGYKSEAAFSSAFKRHFGISPGRYRDQKESIHQT